MRCVPRTCSGGCVADDAEEILSNRGGRRIERTDWNGATFCRCREQPNAGQHSYQRGAVIDNDFTERAAVTKS